MGGLDSGGSWVEIDNSLNLARTSKLLVKLFFSVKEILGTGE